MTDEAVQATPPLAPAERPAGRHNGHRGSSWVPTWPLIATKNLELRKRRGLMVAVLLLTVGLPIIVLGIRLVAHLVSPHSYGPAGSPTVFSGLLAPMSQFGFIIAATLGAAAGTTDLADGVFRQLVVTGRSRLALYLTRLPAGLAIVVPLVALAFASLCLVTAYAGSSQPKTVNENGVSIPANLDRAGFVAWLRANPDLAVQAFAPGPRQLDKHGIDDLYSGDKNDFLGVLNPLPNEMTKIGLWLELNVAVGFIVGLGLGSLIGDRTVATILMIVLEIIVTPIVANVHIPYFLNGQRLFVGVALDQLRPAGFATTTGRRILGGHNALGIPPMPTWAMVSVIVGWIAGWTAIGAWRMTTRDA